MANSVVASNAPRGALLGGVPACVVKREQRADLSASQRAAIVREIFEGNAEALAVLGWKLQDGILTTGRPRPPSPSTAGGSRSARRCSTSTPAA